MKTTITKTLNKIFLASAALMFCASVFAMDLDDAKSAGLVGEQADGYLGIVSSSAGSEVKALVDDINSKRKEKYQEIANGKNIPLVQVEKLAGQKVIERAKPGEYIKESSSWTKK